MSNDVEVPKNGENNERKATMAPDLLESLKETTKRQRAWREYAGYGDDYQRRNAERMQSGRIMLVKIGQATVIGSINVNEFGEAVSGHDYNPKAESHREIESEYERYLAETDPEQRLIIFEGDTRPPTGSLEEAIILGAESGLLQFLSQRDEVKSISGEPSKQEQMQFLAEKGVSYEEVVLYFMVRNLTQRKPGTSLSEFKLPDNLELDIYGQAALLGLEGFESFSEEQKEEIKKDPAKIEQLRARGRVLAENLNKKLHEMGLPTFELGADGDPSKVAIKSAQDMAIFAESWDPSNQMGRLAEIQRIIAECRDKHLFELIADAVAKGKKPFVVYGGSHVVSLEPVLEAYFS